MTMRQLAVLVCLPIFFWAFACADVPQLGQVTGQVHFREGPSRSSRAKEVLATGTEIEIISQDPAGWYLVKHNGHTGFVHGAYIELRPSVQSPTRLNPRTKRFLFLAAMILVGGGIMVMVAILVPFARKIAIILGGSLITVGVLDLGFRLSMLYSLIGVALVLLALVLVLTRKRQNQAPATPSISDTFRKAA
jgi:hypothetical protein